MRDWSWNPMIKGGCVGGQDLHQYFREIVCHTDIIGGIWWTPIEMSKKPSSIFKTIFWSLKIYPRHSELSFEFSGHFTNASWWKHPTWANSVLLQVLADAMEEGRKLLMRSLETSLASGWRYVVVVETHMSTKTCNSNKKQAADCIFQTLSIIEPLPSSKHCRLCLVQHFVALPRVMA